MSEPRAPVSRLRMAFATLALAGTATGALTLGVADHHARSDPRRALAWRGAHPEALLRAAEQGTADDPAAAALARRALRAYPLDGRGYRVLAGRADTPAGEALLRIAVARAPRDLAGHSLLTGMALQRGEFAEALRHIDRLLRVEPALMAQVYPTLQALAATPPARAALAAELADAPPWRPALLARLARDAPDAAAIAPLFERLRKAPGGLRPGELAAWLERLARDRQWDAAYLTWIDALPLERRHDVGNVYNGGFELPESGSGFDWRFGRVPGALVARDATAGMAGGHALHVRFDHRRVPFHHVRQLLALPPGAYRFEGRVKLEALASERGLAWSVSCAEGGPPLGGSDPIHGDAPRWSPFAFDFVVPEAGCGAQWLALTLPARVAAEQRIGGSAWFDDFTIRRARPSP